MGDLTEGSRVGKQGVVVFVILYYSSFVFYFDVVCEIVLFQSHLKPLAGGIEERRRQSSRMDVNLTGARGHFTFLQHTRHCNDKTLTCIRSK